MAKKKVAAPARPFGSIHRHGFVRAAAASPVASSGDVAFNVEQTIALAKQAAKRGVDLAVFPELNLSSYAVDDLFLQDAFLDAVEAGIARLAAETEKLGTVLVVGAPLRRMGRLYNCGVVLSRGVILGVVPKLYLPNYREYYEKRWFASGAGLEGLKLELAGQNVPFGPDLIFAADDLKDFVFHVEICEDYWAPLPPSTFGAMAGALILTNLSASNITIGKADERKLLCASHASRCCAGYVFSAAGPGREHHRSRLGRAGLALRDGRSARRDRALRMGAGAGGRRHRRAAASARADAQRHLQRLRARRRTSRAALPHRPLRAQAGLRRDRPRTCAAPLSLCPQPARAARSGLLRGVQHPGAGAGKALQGDGGQASRHWRLGRARIRPTP